MAKEENYMYRTDGNYDTEWYRLDKVMESNSIQIDFTLF